MVITPYLIEIKENFIGRPFERRRLADSGNMHEPQLLVVYGRRGIGKTELLEQVYRDRNILKFEGIRDKTEAEQRKHVMWQLSEYTHNP